MQAHLLQHVETFRVSDGLGNSMYGDCEQRVNKETWLVTYKAEGDHFIDLREECLLLHNLYTLCCKTKLI